MCLFRVFSLGFSLNSRQAYRVLVLSFLSMLESGEMPWRSAAGPVGHCYICPLSKCKALLVVQLSTLGSHSWGRGIMPLLPYHCVLLLSSLPSGTRAHPHSPWVVLGTFEAARASLPRHTAVLRAGCGAVLLVALCTLRVQAHPCLKHGSGVATEAPVE